MFVRGVCYIYEHLGFLNTFCIRANGKYIIVSQQLTGVYPYFSIEYRQEIYDH